MLRNLENALREKGITQETFAEFLGVNKRTAWNKINGVSELYWSEVKKITNLIPEYTLDYLLREFPEQDSA